MWFETTGGESIEAAVGDAGMLDNVAELAASDVPAIAAFTVVRRVARAGQTTRASYALLSIQPIEVMSINGADTLSTKTDSELDPH